VEALRRQIEDMKSGDSDLAELQKWKDENAQLRSEVSVLREQTAQTDILDRENQS
jgi:cell division protein FtsB